MKISDLKKRLAKERVMTAITLRMPEDVIEDLKKTAPLLGFSGYQPLMRAYIGQGLRADLERLNAQPELVNLMEILRRRGIAEDVLAAAMTEAVEQRKAA